MENVREGITTPKLPELPQDRSDRPRDFPVQYANVPVPPRLEPSNAPAPAQAPTRSDLLGLAPAQYMEQLQQRASLGESPDLPAIPRADHFKEEYPQERPGMPPLKDDKQTEMLTEILERVKRIEEDISKIGFK